MQARNPKRSPWILTTRGLLVTYGAWIIAIIALSKVLYPGWLVLLAAISFGLLTVALVGLKMAQAVGKGLAEEIEQGNLDELTIQDDVLKSDLSMNPRVVIEFLATLVIIGAVIFGAFWLGYHFGPVSGALLLLLAFLLRLKLKGWEDTDGSYIVKPINLSDVLFTIKALFRKLPRDLLAFILSFAICAVMGVLFVVTSRVAKGMESEALYFLSSVGATLMLFAVVFGTCSAAVVSRKKFKDAELAEIDEGLRGFFNEMKEMNEVDDEESAIASAPPRFLNALVRRPSLIAAMLLATATASLIVLPGMGGAGNLSEVRIFASAGFVAQNLLELVLQDLGSVVGINISDLQPEGIQARTYVVMLKYIMIGLLLLYIYSVRAEIRLDRISLKVE